ncbi:MAG: tetratricopeptide repeat protein, partial [Pontiella sp.]
MPNLEVKRKLAAILSADVEGYSRLMGDDEISTIRTLNVYKEAITALILQYRGRVVDSPGDNLLAEFVSVVDAVQCAVEIQRKLAERNAELPEDHRMEFRIGVNLGDVVEEEDRIYGDGVNIAARLESLAEGGGICISRNAYDQVKTKLDLKFEYLGEKELKNIAEPVRAYRVQLETDNAASKLNARLELPDKPSIAVLPFNNMSGDPEQNYFAEGISEDITTELSRFHSIFVISRNSAFTYRGNSVDVRQVGRELGVEYIVEGSVRKAGNRIRVTAQLIAVATGHHVWAERYDRNLEDIFDVQDEITETIVSTLAGRIEAAGIERAKRKNTENMVAYDYLLRGLDFHKSGRTTREEAVQAVEMLTKAVELDPEFARAHAWLACASAGLWPASPSRKHMDDAMARVQKALSLDENECEAHRIIGAIYLHRKRFDRAEYHISKAIALNPNNAHIAVKAASFYSYTGRYQEAVASVKRAMRLNPHHPDWYWQELGHAFYVDGQYTNAIRAFNRIAKLVEFDYAYLAACCVALGENEQAKSHITELLRLKPDASVRYYEKTQPFKNDADLERFIDALRKAG